MHDHFLGIQGQGNALEILSQIYSSGRIPHALLFTGHDGVGKFHTAIQFIKLLNKNTSETIQRNINSLSEPYIKLITPLPRGKSETNSDHPTAKLGQDILDELHSQISSKSKNPYHKFVLKNANNIKINSIREINKIISLNYDEIPYRGVVILDSHKMSIEAQNAFLKNLEEPPEGVIYILISDNPDHLLTTIKSRCWEIPFSPLNDNELEMILENHFGYDGNQLESVVSFSNGSVTNALYLIEYDIDKLLQRTILILRYSLANKYYTAAKEFYNIIADNSVALFQLIVDFIIAWFVDTQKIKTNPESIKFINHKETLEKFNQRFSDADIGSTISKLVEYRNAPNRNVSLNLTVMNVIFELASIGMKSK